MNTEMDPTRQSPNVQFLEDLAAEERVRSHVASCARPCVYIAERFTFRQHLYEAVELVDPSQLVEKYLAFLGLQPMAARNLVELAVERAYEMLAEMFRWDLARQEELVTEEETRLFMQRIQEQTESWAVLAFTNMNVPEPRAYRLGSYPFHRVVAEVGSEGGVILVGEQELSMIWFVDDDGPTRAMYDRRYR
jgi:hypothetical protein